MMPRNFLAIVLLLTAVTARAESKYLVPVIYPQPIPGAFGSLWRSTLTVHNRNDRTVSGVGLHVVDCAIPTCVSQLRAKQTVDGVPEGAVFPGKNGPGSFLLVGDDARDSLGVSLRVQDVSRLADRWGTDIPVVPLSRALTRTAQLLGVPTDTRYRQMLRIYDFDSRENARVEVALYAANGTLLGIREVPLRTSLVNIERALHPGYAEIAWLTAEFPQITAYDQIRIEVRPLTTGLRFWTFVSVTNDTTQEVTNVFPATE